MKGKSVMCVVYIIVLWLRMENGEGSFVVFGKPRYEVFYQLTFRHDCMRLTSV